jgi:hypothetical protein
MKSKVCTKCRKRKLIKFFAKDKRLKCGFRSWCNPCLSKLANHPRYYVKTRYGITYEQYCKMFWKQAGSCAICYKSYIDNKRGLEIDHNHTTKEVRGFLCRNCNVAYGLLKEDISIMKNLLKYHNKHKD